MCNECHTPTVFDPELKIPVKDMSRMLSGHPEGAPDPEGKSVGHDMAVIGPTFTSFNLPFGTVYTANLTPDKETGLGNWTEKNFVGTFRIGRHLGLEDGIPLLPPMPWEYVANLNDADLKAIFAYLQSIPAIKNQVPSPKVPQEVIQGMSETLDKVMAKMAGKATPSKK